MVWASYSGAYHPWFLICCSLDADRLSYVLGSEPKAHEAVAVTLICGLTLTASSHVPFTGTDSLSLFSCILDSFSSENISKLVHRSVYQGWILQCSLISQNARSIKTVKLCQCSGMRCKPTTGPEFPLVYSQGEYYTHFCRNRNDHWEKRESTEIVRGHFVSICLL